MEILDLNNCHLLPSLPPYISGLMKLRVLNISFSKVQELLEDFGKLQCLVDFNAGGCSALSRIRESFGQLVNLATLVLEG